MSGLNSATRAGEGDAFIFNWQQTNNTLNRLYQKEIYEGKARRDAFNKSAIELQKAGEGIRPQDIPSITNHYNTWKNAETLLLDPKIKKNPELVKELRTKSSEALTSYMAEAGDSKNFAKEFPQYKMRMLEDKGHNYDIERLSEWEKEVNQLSTKDLRARGIDVPAHLILGNDAHDPNKFDQEVLGKRITKNLETPGKVDPITKLPIEYVQTATELPQYDYSEVARRAAEKIAGNTKLQRDVNREFQSTDPALIKQTIESARQIMKQDPRNGTVGAEKSLQDNDPYSYKIAQAIVRNQPRDLGEVGRRANHEHDNKLRQIQHKEDKAQQAYFQGQNLNIARQRLGLEYQKYSDKKKVDNADNLAITQMYEAANKPNDELTLPNGKKILGRHLVDNYVQTITSNNPEGIKGVVLNRADITDPKERDRLAKKLGIEVRNKFAGKLNKEQLEEGMLDDFVYKVNEMYPNLKLTKESVSNKAIPVFLKSKNQSVPTGKMNKDGSPIYTYQTIKSAVAADPSIEDLGGFGSVVTQNNAKKKKSQEAKDDDVLDELNSSSNRPTAPTAPKSSKWSKYKRN